LAHEPHDGCPILRKALRRRHTQAPKILLRGDEILAKLAKAGQSTPSGKSRPKTKK